MFARNVKFSSSLLLAMVLLIAISTVAYASCLCGCFFYWQYGLYGPTYECWFIDGSTEDNGFCDCTAPDGRLFAPPDSNVTTDYWTDSNNEIFAVNWEFDWDIPIGSYWSDLETNTDRQYRFGAETRVADGWWWQGFDITGWPNYDCHELDDAIYKDDHVEADVWSKTPENFNTNISHFLEHIFTPKTGYSFSELSKTRYQELKIYEYSAAVSFTGHGDPRDGVVYYDNSNWASSYSIDQSNERMSQQKLTKKILKIKFDKVPPEKVYNMLNKYELPLLDITYISSDSTGLIKAQPGEKFDELVRLRNIALAKKDKNRKILGITEITIEDSIDENTKKALSGEKLIDTIVKDEI